MSALLSDRLSTLGVRFMGSGGDEQMVLDKIAYTAIGTLLLDMADDATVLETKAGVYGSGEADTEKEDGFAVIDLAETRALRDRARNPENAA